MKLAASATPQVHFPTPLKSPIRPPMNAPASMADLLRHSASKAAGAGVCAFTTPKTTTKTTG